MAAYKTYLIRSNLTGQVWIEKDGSFIAWAENEEQAKATVDTLTGAPRLLFSTTSKITADEKCMAMHAKGWRAVESSQDASGLINITFEKAGV